MINGLLVLVLGSPGCWCPSRSCGSLLRVWFSRPAGGAANGHCIPILWEQEGAALMSPAEGISAEPRLKIGPAERQAKEQRGRNTVCGFCNTALVCLRTCELFFFWHKYLPVSYFSPIISTRFQLFLSVWKKMVLKKGIQPLIQDEA